MKIYRLKESKTTQLKKLLKNGNITEEQFQIADEFFKKYSAFEKEIDWNRGLSITWDDLKAVIYKERNSESQVKKRIRKGLEGFTEGKDYLVLEETDSYTAYQPFTWEASRMIASHYVEPSRNEEGDLDDADWCIAFQKCRNYWDEYNEMEAFIYICGESIPTKKVAIAISDEDYNESLDEEFLYTTGSLYYNIWDSKDYSDTIEDSELLDKIPNLYDLIKRAYKNWEKKKFQLVYNPKTKRYDYEGNLSNRVVSKYIKPNMDGFTINFGVIKRNFDCSDLGLTSLKGAPTEVGGDFNCSNNILTSLKGAPQEVGGDFDCHWNRLTSLKGAPREVGGNFNCSETELTSLEGAPQKVGGSFDCGDNQLTSLEGAPKEVGRDFECYINKLTSLEGAPQYVGKGFYCSNNQLTSLNGAPQSVKTYLYCSNNKLTSLEGAPREVGWNFDCSNNKLTSLEGAPQKSWGWYFNCSNNQLTSLKGAPIKVEKDFNCSNNQLTSLKGAPQEVGRNFDCRNNPSLHSLDGLGEVKGEIIKGF